MYTRIYIGVLQPKYVTLYMYCMILSYAKDRKLIDLIIVKINFHDKSWFYHVGHCDVTLPKSTPKHQEKYILNYYRLWENIDNSFLNNYDKRVVGFWYRSTHGFRSRSLYSNQVYKIMYWPHQNTWSVQNKANTVHVRECKAVF